MKHYRYFISLLGAITLMTACDFLDVVPDARLERGACLLESELGVVDASLETQLKALENALRSKIAS